MITFTVKPITTKKFPVDFLRKYQCHPLTPNDSALLNRNITGKDRKSAISFEGTATASNEVWESIGWRLVVQC